MDISAPGVDSGVDTVDGRSIYLYLESGRVYGRAELAAGSGVGPGAGNGDVAFILSVNNVDGNFGVNQYLAIKHSDSNDPDEAGAPETFNPGTVFGRVVVEDGDGDRQGVNIDISEMIKFEDDGPTLDIPGVPVTMLEGQVTNGAWNLNEGTDGVDFDQRHGRGDHQDAVIGGSREHGHLRFL